MSAIVYILLNKKANKTYVGVTNDLERRLRQHNGEIVGGARQTTRANGRWKLAGCVYPFQSRHHALRFEWHIHHPDRLRKRLKRCRRPSNDDVPSHSLLKRRNTLIRKIMQFDEWQQHGCRLRWFI